MDKFDLINAVFKAEPTERVPYAIWKHFPEDDKSPEGLLKAQMDFQTKFDSDIMKISISGRAFASEFGAVLGGYDPDSGSRICMKYPIEKLEDWNNIKEIDPNNGEFGNQIKAMKLVANKVKDKVPTMMTVFSPLMVASQIDKNIILHYREDPQFVREQFKIVESAMTEFTKASLDAGADGIFLATQHLNQRLTPDERMMLEFTPMKSLIQHSKKANTFVVLHLHGDNPDFELATKLPVDAINWHDQQTTPNLAEGRQIYKGGLLGGLNTESWKDISALKEISSMITSVYQNFRGSGLILAPGCVIPQYISDPVIETAVTTIQNLKSS
ncbi:MAG: uroporphyrinogen decarboxylase family protein [Promethearchaeota archaeon]|jgi:uroporphyrinogen decarboxylase